MKSRAAILIASIPKLAPRVPAPISEGTSINLIFFIKEASLVVREAQIYNIPFTGLLFIQGCFGSNERFIQYRAHTVVIGMVILPGVAFTH